MTGDPGKTDRELFIEFLNSYYPIEVQELREVEEKDSLILDWTDLNDFDEELAQEVQQQPGDFITDIQMAIRTAGDVPFLADVQFANYPHATLSSELRAADIGTLASVEGKIQTVSEVKPRLVTGAFTCKNCSQDREEEQQYEVPLLQEPFRCIKCDSASEYRLRHEDSEFVDFQDGYLIDEPEADLPTGIGFWLEDELVTSVSSGDEVRMTGVVTSEQEVLDGELQPTYKLRLKVHSVEKFSR